MVQSVLAVPTARKVKHDFERKGRYFLKKKHSDTESQFSQALEQEVGELQAKSLNCHTLTYGDDRKVHRFDYQVREYH
ncbi:MAG: hypothetical protein ACI4TB_10840 [Lachnospiraceae bacterium]